MPIIDLQRRLREIGRIRIGDAVDTGRVYEKGAKEGQPIKRPRKLGTFRLTSQDESIIQVAAQAFGGQSRPWEDAPAGHQWEVTTTRSCLDVIVPPGGMAFSQFYETWSGGGCQKRCDGQWDNVRDCACTCDPTERECKPHTRLSVILRDLPGLGVWRLDTSGYYAAVELSGVVEVCERASERGQMLPARLMVEEREVKRIANGKAETRKFGVPTLDVDLNFAQLMSGRGPALEVDGSTREITGPREQPAFAPVPSLPPGPQPSIAEQVAGKGVPSKPARKNAQTPIPATGVKVRTAAQTDIRVADAVRTIGAQVHALDPDQLATYEEEAQAHGWPKVTAPVSQWNAEQCLAALAVLAEIAPGPEGPDDKSPAPKREATGGDTDRDPMTGVDQTSAGEPSNSPVEPGHDELAHARAKRTTDPFAPSQFHRVAAAKGMTDEADRRAVLYVTTWRRTTSASQCTPEEIAKAIAMADDALRLPDYLARIRGEYAERSAAS